MVLRAECEGEKGRGKREEGKQISWLDGAAGKRKKNGRMAWRLFGVLGGDGGRKGEEKTGAWWGKRGVGRRKRKIPGWMAWRKKERERAASRGRLFILSIYYLCSFFVTLEDQGQNNTHNNRQIERQESPYKCRDGNQRAVIVYVGEISYITPFRRPHGPGHWHEGGDEIDERLTGDHC